MRAVLVTMVAAGIGAGCAPILAPQGRTGSAWSRASAPGPAVSLAAVMGRWDNVMMLPKGHRVLVLRMNGVRAEGEIVLATSSAVRLLVAGGEIEMAVEEVARIDRATAADRGRRILSGAAHGAGFVGLVGLLIGHAPPPRVFAAGALAGAEAGAHEMALPGSQTVYLSPQVKRQAPRRW